MRLPRSFRSRAWGVVVLLLLGCVGILASRPPNTQIQLVVFFLSGAGLLAGSVVFSGALIRGVIIRCGASDAAAAKTFRRFIGIGFSASAAYLLGVAAMDLALITFHPGPASDFVYSEREQAWSALGGAVISVFFWPAQGVSRLMGQAMPGWLSWLSCSLLYGVTLYGSITFIRQLLARTSGKRMAEPGASPNGGRAKPVGNSGVTEGPPSVS